MGAQLSRDPPPPRLWRTSRPEIHTSKADKYDRYLAGVFLAGTSRLSSEALAKADIFLNNYLLENGFAERKDAWEFGDWNF